MDATATLAAQAPLTLEQRQLALEGEMQDMGIERYLNEVDRAKGRVAESETKYGQRLLMEIMDALVPAIKDFIKTSGGGQGEGRAHVGYKYLKCVRPETAAYIATRTILDALSIQLPLTGTAIRIANCIEDEVRFMGYNKLPDKRKRNYYRKVNRNLKKETQDHKHRRKAIKGVMRRIGAPDWDNWQTSDKVHLGTKLVELVATSLGIVEIKTRSLRKNRMVHCIEPTDKGRAWIKDFNEHHQALCPQYLPMLLQPREWTNPYDGGYLSDFLRRRMPLVKTSYKDYLEELTNADMGVVYGAVNAMQNTAWKINERLYLVLRQLRNSGSEIGKLPSIEDEPRPTKPLDIDTNRESRKAWKRAATIVERNNIKLASKRLQVSKTLWVATKFRKEKDIFFPYQLDFRGRAYAAPMFLHPQGPDYAKALLTFATGKPIVDKTAADWLAIHGANVWGYDKVPFSERVAWVNKNEENIRLSAEEPLDYLWWTKADKPWQMLAWCFEWAEFKKVGMGFVSTLPIALDGSCNGLQHFSAMLLDANGGKAVNLTPADKPQDIYQVVCDRLVAKLKALTNEIMAHQWLAFGITRKTTKRCVMVLPYGGTVYAFRKYLQEHIIERIDEGAENPFGTTEFFRPGNFLAILLNEAIGETVKAAVEAMQWLQKVALIVAAEGLPITWTTPSGFPVMQAYQDTAEKQIKTQIFGEVNRLTIREKLSTIDRRRQANGIAPNFVHALDAAAMMHCLVDAKAIGISSFAMIHDSYATVAADTEDLSVALRYAFVHQVYNHDVLQEFADEVSSVLTDAQLPALPKKGTLDISSVEQSAFFFA